MKPSVLFAAAACLLPASRMKNRVLSLVPGWYVAPSASVAPILVVNVFRLHVDEGGTILAGNSLRNLRSVHLGRNAIIGRANWFSSSPMFWDEEDDELVGTLRLEDESAITARHHVDCSGGVIVGRLSIVAGHNSSILTHSVDFTRAVQAHAPIYIGEACFIGSNAIITRGVSIANRIVVGAGAVVVNDLTQSEHLYAGNPAICKVPMTGAAFFTRRSGHIGTVPELDG